MKETELPPSPTLRDLSLQLSKKRRHKRTGAIVPTYTLMLNDPHTGEREGVNVSEAAADLLIKCGMELK